MKKLNYLLAAALTAVTLTATFSARAGEPFYTPKGKEVADSLKKVPGTDRDTVDLAMKNRPNGNAKAWDLARSLRTVPSTGPSIDLAHGPRPLISPKDPRYDREVRRLQEVQIAPLK